MSIFLRRGLSNCTVIAMGAAVESGRPSSPVPFPHAPNSKVAAGAVETRASTFLSQESIKDCEGSF